MYGWRARLGLLTPSVNTVSEPEWNAHVPDGVMVHAARMLLDREVTPEGIRHMNEDVERAAASVATADPDVVVYGVTAGSFLDPGLDEEIEEQLTDVTGVPGIATAASMKRGLSAVGAESVAVATPYTETLNELEREFLEAAGFDVVAMSARGIDSGTDLAGPTPGSAYRQARAVDTDDADAVYISGMNYHVLPMLPELEADLDKPVLSSNQVSIWDALRTAGVEYSSLELGSLFDQ
jgi:maleate isomerase